MATVAAAQTGIVVVPSGDSRAPQRGRRQAILGGSGGATSGASGS